MIAPFAVVTLALTFSNEMLWIWLFGAIAMLHNSKMPNFKFAVAFFPPTEFVILRFARFM